MAFKKVKLQHGKRKSPKSLGRGPVRPAGLERINRTLRMISECNQALVRATGEAALMESICEILVEKGGYRLAWVGFIEPGDSKRVRPIAHAGREEGYLQGVNITWDNSERGRGPTGTAIRNGKPVFIRNIKKDPSFGPWREAALKRGYASSIALPLADRGESFGALTLYSSKPEAFDKTEISLLMELAGDLAFGLTALRTAAEHTRLEGAVRASEIQLNLILNNVSDIIFSVSVEPGGVFRFSAANRRFLETTGLKKEQVVGSLVRDIIPPPAHDLVFGKYCEAIEGGRPAHWEEVSDYPAGRKYGHVTVVPVFDARGACSQLIGMVHDITEGKRFEEKLTESERKYRELVEYANSIILRWTKDGRVTFLNEFGLRFFGYEAAEILGRHVTGTIVPETETSGRDLSGLMDRICADPQAFEQNVNENMRRNGERVWISWTNRIVKDAQGQVAEILSVGTDVTGQKRAQDAVKELNASLERRVAERTAELAVERDRAEAADRLKSSFLATMSHELRTPLNSIIGFTGIILQGMAGPLNEEQAKQLGMVQASARHLLALINDVLDISKIEAGQLDMVWEPLDLKDSIRKAVEMVRPLAEKKGLDLRLEIAPEIGPVVSDPRRVEQILLNLLNNAVKFTERGSVTLRAAPGPGVTRISVEDTGIGIKAEDFGKMFQPFRQLDSGLTRQHEGTGLGLAICQKLAQLLGGEIRAESVLGRGSVFTFCLPLKGPGNHGK